MKNHIDISIAEISEAYAGDVGELWEMLMERRSTSVVQWPPVNWQLWQVSKKMTMCWTSAAPWEGLPAILLQSSGAGL